MGTVRQEMQANASLCIYRAKGERECRSIQPSLLSWLKTRDLVSVYRNLVWKSGDKVPVPGLVMTSVLEHSPIGHSPVGKQVIFIFCAFHLPICTMGMTVISAVPFLAGVWLRG